MQEDFEREAWIFYPASQAAASQRFRKDTEAFLRAQGCGFMARPLESVRLPGGRMVDLLDEYTARDVYRQAHRKRLAVCLLSGHAVVSLRPSQGRHVWERYIRPLERYCRYKAFLVHGQRAANVWYTAFVNWCNPVDCEGDQDPRCLPLHVFTSDDFRGDLNLEEGRDAFKAAYGPASHRTDEASFQWRLQRHDLHGREVLHVRRLKLAPGFHWDVDAPAARSHLYTTHEEWEFGVYLNLSPDASVRRTPKSRKLYPRENGR